MKKKTQISKEDLESLLNWLSPNSEEAGIKYEKIRLGLARYFRYKGCSEPDELADETINRVAVKIDKLDVTTGVKKISIFLGFAYNIFLEYLRFDKNLEVPMDNNFPLTSRDQIYDESLDDDLDCLEKCLNELPREEKELITLYFSEEKAKKIKLRKKIAKKIGITPNALHVRIYRIKNGMKKCIENCNKKKTL